MAPTYLPVAGVAPTRNAGRRPSVACTPSAATHEVSAPNFQPDIIHNQDALSTVQGPKPPPSPSCTPTTTLSHSSPARITTHVRPGVTRVAPINEAAAKQSIEKLTSSAVCFLDKWPLSGLVRFVWGDKETQTKQSKAKVAQDTTEAMQEEDMIPDVAPPPYSLSKS